MPLKPFNEEMKLGISQAVRNWNSDGVLKASDVEKILIGAIFTEGSQDIQSILSVVSRVLFNEFEETDATQLNFNNSIGFESGVFKADADLSDEQKICRHLLLETGFKKMQDDIESDAPLGAEFQPGQAPSTLSQYFYKLAGIEGSVEKIAERWKSRDTAPAAGNRPVTAEESGTAVSVNDITVKFDDDGANQDSFREVVEVVLRAQKEETETAATTVQAAFRGHQVRAEVGKQNKAATKIQALRRGIMVRNKLKETEAGEVPSEEEKAEADRAKKIEDLTNRSRAKIIDKFFKKAISARRERSVNNFGEDGIIGMIARGEGAYAHRDDYDPSTAGIFDDDEAKAKAKAIKDSINMEEGVHEYEKESYQKGLNNLRLDLGENSDLGDTLKAIQDRLPRALDEKIPPAISGLGSAFGDLKRIKRLSDARGDVNLKAEAASEGDAVEGGEPTDDKKFDHEIRLYKQLSQQLPGLGFLLDNLEGGNLSAPENDGQNFESFYKNAQIVSKSIGTASQLEKSLLEYRKGLFAGVAKDAAESVLKKLSALEHQNNFEKDGVIGMIARGEGAYAERDSYWTDFLFEDVGYKAICMEGRDVDYDKDVYSDGLHKLKLQRETNVDRYNALDKIQKKLPGALDKKIPVAIKGLESAFSDLKRIKKLSDEKLKSGAEFSLKVEADSEPTETRDGKKFDHEIALYRKLSQQLPGLGFLLDNLEGGNLEERTPEPTNFASFYKSALTVSQSIGTEGQLQSSLYEYSREDGSFEFLGGANAEEYRDALQLIESLESEKERLSGTINGFEEKNELLTRKIEENEAKILALESQITEHLKDIAQQNTDLASKNAELIAARSAIEALNKSLADNQAEYEGSLKNLQEYVARVIAEKDAQIAELQAKITDALDKALGVVGALGGTTPTTPTAGLGDGLGSTPTSTVTVDLTELTQWIENFRTATNAELDAVTTKVRGVADKIDGVKGVVDETAVGVKDALAAAQEAAAKSEAARLETERATVAAQEAKKAAEEAKRAAEAAQAAAERGEKAAQDSAYETSKSLADFIMNNSAGSSALNPPVATVTAPDESTTITAEEFRKSAVASGSNNWIPSVVGGAEGISNGYVPVALYDGAETTNLFASHTAAAVSAWADLGEVHDANTRYTSLGGQSQKTLVAIAKLTNRDLPGGEVDTYCVNTVTARGLTQSFISDIEFAKEIQQPVTDFYDSQKKAMTEALRVGRVLTSEELLKSSLEPKRDGLGNIIPRSVEEIAVKAGAVDALLEKKRADNWHKAETKVDEDLKGFYGLIVGAIDDTDKDRKEDKERATEFLKIGDYAALRRSLSDENGNLKAVLFVDAADVAGVSISGAPSADVSVADAWSELGRRRDGFKGDELVALYESLVGKMLPSSATNPQKGDAEALLNQAKDSFATEEDKAKARENLHKLLTDDKGNLKTDLFDLARTGATATAESLSKEWSDLNAKKSGAVAALSDFSTGSLPIIREVLEKEKIRLAEFSDKRTKAKGEEEFLLGKYRKIVDLMNPLPGKEELKLELDSSANGFNAVFDRLFNTDNANLTASTVKDDFIFGANKDKALELYKKEVLGVDSVGTFAVPDQTQKRQICAEILDLVDITRPTQAEMKRLLDGGKRKQFLDRLFELNGDQKHPSVFDSATTTTDLAAAQALRTESLDPAKKEEHAEQYLETHKASQRGAMLKKFDDAIKEITEYEAKVKDSLKADSVVGVPSLDQAAICRAITEFKLDDKIAAEVAKANSGAYLSAHTSEKTKRAIEKTQVVSLDEDERKRCGGGSGNFKMENLLKTDLPIPAYKGVHFAHQSLSKTTIVINDPNQVAYAHIKGTNQAYVRVQTCTEKHAKTRIGPDGNSETYYALDVYKNGKLVQEEHKVGDVVMDYGTVFHKVKDGYKPINIGSTLSFHNTGEHKFKADDFEIVKRKYNDLQVMAVGIGANGERSVATFMEGKTVNHSAPDKARIIGYSKASSPWIGGMPKFLGGTGTDINFRKGEEATKLQRDTKMFDIDGKKIEFEFDAEGNLKGGTEYQVFPMIYNARYVTVPITTFEAGEKKIEKEPSIDGIQVFGQVRVVAGEKDTSSASSATVKPNFGGKVGDVVFSDNLYFKNADKCYPVLDKNAKALSADFVKFLKEGRSIDQDAQDDIFKKVNKMVGDLKLTPPSVAVTIKTTGCTVREVECDDNNFTLKKETKKIEPRVLNAVVGFGEVEKGKNTIAAPSELKEDLLQIEGNRVLKGTNKDLEVSPNSPNPPDNSEITDMKSLHAEIQILKDGQIKKSYWFRNPAPIFSPTEFKGHKYEHARENRGSSQGS